MRENKFKAIIFDFNGTLFWDSDKHEEAWRRYSKRLRGYALSDEEMHTAIHGHVNRDIAKYLYGREATEEEFMLLNKEKEELYRELCLADKENFKLASGVTELLDYLKKEKFPMTIGTAAEITNLTFYIERFDLGKWFDIDKIVYDNQTFPGKPAPDVYLRSAATLNIAPRDCIVVEDALSGIKAAKAAGIGKIVAVGKTCSELDKVDGVAEAIYDFHEFDRNWLTV